MQFEDDEELINGELKSQWLFWFPDLNVTGWCCFLDENAFFVNLCLRFVSSLFESVNLINAILFIFKLVPMVICMYQFVQNYYLPSRERIRQRRMEYEDLQLQLEIINSKLNVHDADLDEQAEEIRRATERFQQGRARARDVISSDELLKQAVYVERENSDEADENMAIETLDEEFIMELLKDSKHEDTEVQNRLGCGEPQYETADNSVYSSLSDPESQGCRIKIVKVTNVYKVAYLRHYIKQKRMKRSSKQAELKKKMDSIKQLLDDWHRTLSLVSRSQALQLDGSYQEGMGDYSYRNSLRDSSSSDNDLKNLEIDTDWPNQRGYYGEDIDVYTAQEVHSARFGGNGLFDLPEETMSELQLAETRSNADLT